MRISLNKRLVKLEQAFPPPTEAEAHEAVWREAFSEFGIPPDTSAPDHRPIIRQLIEADGTPSDKLLRLNGQFVGKLHCSS
jgi:hypothetical protein